MNQPGPITAVDDAIVIEYGQFVLQDVAGRQHAGRLPVDFQSTWRMVVGPGGALFHSDSMDREVPIRLELWPAKPAAAAEPWEQVGEGVTEAESTRMRLLSITGAMTPHLLELQHSGPHYVRAYLHTTLDHENLEEYETDIQEEWLIQLWPVEKPQMP